jgi:hypothetical protein
MLSQAVRENVSLTYRAAIVPTAEQYKQNPNAPIEPSRIVFSINTKLPIGQWQTLLEKIPGLVFRQITLNTQSSWIIEGDIFDANSQNGY